MNSVAANTAFVFGCHYNGLSIIQELGRRGVRVYAVDSTRSVGTYSRYARFWHCPDPLENEAEFINFLLDKGAGFTHPPLLFPTYDHWATAISKHKDRLEQYYILCVSDWGTVELLVCKDKFYPWAMESSYPVPRLYSLDDLMRANPGAFPVIAKPIYRRMSTQVPGMYDITRHLDQNRMVVLKSTTALNNFVTANEDLLPYLIFQEYIPGMADRMYTVGIYANREHEVLGVFTGRKVRGFPPDIGDCVVGQAEKLPPEIVALVKEIVKALHFQGIAEFEFKRDLRNNEFKLIEINPRSWSWIGITPACDVSLPWMAYVDLTGIEAVTYRESTIDCGAVKYIKIIEDLKNCLYGNKRAGFPEYNMSVVQWWKSLRAKKRIYAEFAWNDPMPGVLSLAEFIKAILIALFRKTVGIVRYSWQRNKV